MGTSSREPFFNRNRKLNDTEIKIYAAFLISEGLPAGKVCQIIKEEYGVTLTSKAPTRYFQEYGRKGRVEFIPPNNFELQTRLGRHVMWLQGLEVLQTVASKHISEQGARTCLRMMAEMVADRDGGGEVHIGIGGGLQTRAFVCQLVKRLDLYPGPKPARIVFHGMVPGVHLNDPSLDPAFLYMLVKEKFDPQTVELDFVPLGGPILVDAQEIDPVKLKNLPGIQEAMAEAAKLDIIVTSAASWHDECSAYRRNMSVSPENFRALETSGIRGDFCFQPFSDRGAIEDHPGLRFLTLMELSQFPEFIKKGGKVMFLLGPCNDCRSLKHGVLEVLLGGGHKWFTHLILDSHSAEVAHEILTMRDANS